MERQQRAAESERAMKLQDMVVVYRAAIAKLQAQLEQEQAQHAETKQQLPDPGRWRAHVNSEQDAVG